MDLIPSGQDELAWHSTDLFGETEINSLSHSGIRYCVFIHIQDGSISVDFVGTPQPLHHQRIMKLLQFLTENQNHEIMFQRTYIPVNKLIIRVWFTLI